MALRDEFYSLIWLAAAMAQMRKVFMEPDTVPSPAVAMTRRQRAFANPMPDGLRPRTGALRSVRHPT